MKTDLKTLLQEWDGTHTEYLQAVYRSHVKDEKFFDTIIRLYLSSTQLKRITSWLIKHHYDYNNQLSQDQIIKILSHVDKLEHWESKLHILQLIPSFDLDIQNAESIEPFIKKALRSEKKFVKAAAYEAYFEIVKLKPGLQREFKSMCEEALKKESASIKSKVKKIIEKLTYV
jgi:hypothetical protein